MSNEGMISAEQARAVLSQVEDSGSGRSVLELGWIDNIRIEPPRALVRFTLPNFAQSQRDRLANEVKELLANLEGIEEVQIEMKKGLQMRREQK